MRLKYFPVQYQRGKFDCGPTCLKIIATYFGKNCSWKELLHKCHLSEKGTSLKGLSAGLEYLGLKCLAVKGTIEDLIKNTATRDRFLERATLCGRLSHNKTVCLCFRPVRRTYLIYV